VAIGAALLIGALLGLINGLLSRRSTTPSSPPTERSGCCSVCLPDPAGRRHSASAFRVIGNGKLLGVRCPSSWRVFSQAISSCTTRRSAAASSYGQTSNRQDIGIKVERVIVIAYIISGFLQLSPDSC
jgi:ribose/xylose/arabinose/galactoside ABC-type transport system permease subunit